MGPCSCTHVPVRGQAVRLICELPHPGEATLLCSERAKGAEKASFGEVVCPNWCFEESTLFFGEFSESLLSPLESPCEFVEDCGRPFSRFWMTASANDPFAVPLAHPVCLHCQSLPQQTKATVIGAGVVLAEQSSGGDLGLNENPRVCQ